MQYSDYSSDSGDDEPMMVGSSPGSRNLLWGGRFTRGAAMYAKLFERRRGVQSAYDGGGGGGEQSAYDGGGGGCSRQVTLINSSLTCTHSLLKHKKHHGKRVHSAPALSCSTASLTFVRTTELSGLLVWRNTLSVDLCRREGGGGGGGGRQKLPGGGISYAMGGAAAPPKAMLDPGLLGSDD